MECRPPSCATWSRGTWRTSATSTVWPESVDTFVPGLVPRQPLWEPIAAALRRAILLGELPESLHLEEPGLAEKFGVSRIPDREAVSLLEHEGLVRVEPPPGAFVAGVTDYRVV